MFAFLQNVYFRDKPLFWIFLSLKQRDAMDVFWTNNPEVQGSNLGSVSNIFSSNLSLRKRNPQKKYFVVFLHDS